MILMLVILILALFGGLQAYTNPIIMAGLGTAGWVTMIAACIAARPKPVIWPVIWPFGLAVVISFLANLDIFDYAAGRVYLYTTALAVLLVSARWVTARQLLYSLILAAGLWLAADLWLRVYDNQNIKAVWPGVFILALAGAHSEGWFNKWEYGLFCLPFFVYLLVLGSRGAALGLAVGLSVFITLISSNRKEVMWTLGLVWLALAAVMAALWRYETALYRLYYWQEAWSVFLANPLFGVGPGGLKARELITEPSGGFQLHAHNFIISSGAELGLVGLAAMAFTGFRLYVQRSTFNVQPWQAAIVTALLCHGLVDEPLYWPGPLFLAALVVGTIKERSGNE